MSYSRSCCILTISSSLSQGQRIVEQIVGEENSATNPFAAVTTETTIQLPWMISNKYYTAPVQFSVNETRHVKAEDAAGVPACMFVFAVTEPFKEDFQSLMSRFRESDFEVSIAVSLPSPSVGQFTEAGHEALEGFFGEYGFEYVNGLLGLDHSQEHDIDNMDAVPGLGRIVDALSTIIWPSMVHQSGSRRTKVRSVVSGAGLPDDEDSLRALLNADKDTSISTAHKREMAALEKWLEEGADTEKDPWSGQTFESRPQELLNAEESRSAISGFDDNFSDFVSAPAPAAEGATDIDNDQSLPSQAEIEAASRRIFGANAADYIDEMDEGDSQAPFDLSRVLGALEAMKEEIAGITNESEKRKAAARVALGFVYGLEDG